MISFSFNISAADFNKEELFVQEQCTEEEQLSKTIPEKTLATILQQDSDFWSMERAALMEALQQPFPELKRTKIASETD